MKRDHESNGIIAAADHELPPEPHRRLAGAIESDLRPGMVIDVIEHEAKLFNPGGLIVEVDSVENINPENHEMKSRV